MRIAWNWWAIKSQLDLFWVPLVITWKKVNHFIGYFSVEMPTARNKYIAVEYAAWFWSHAWEKKIQVGIWYIYIYIVTLQMSSHHLLLFTSFIRSLCFLYFLFAVLLSVSLFRCVCGFWCFHFSFSVRVLFMSNQQHLRHHKCQITGYYSLFQLRLTARQLT